MDVNIFYGAGAGAKIQQTKMLVTCQRFVDWFLFGLVWPYSSIQKNIMKVGSQSLLLTCSRVWPNSLDCTDLNQCGVRRDAELCRLCYKSLSGLP